MIIKKKRSRQVKRRKVKKNNNNNTFHERVHVRLTQPISERVASLGKGTEVEGVNTAIILDEKVLNSFTHFFFNLSHTLCIYI